LQSEGAVTVSLKVIPTDAIDINRHIGMMYELKELEPSFYNDLIKLSVLQGTASTNLSISNIIPLEDRAKIIAPVIETLRASEELNGFDREGMFYRNNFKDERIVPEIKPRYKYAIRESVDGISIDYSKVDTFVTMLTYGIKPGNAKIISLNNKYSFMNEADKDFVKMRRYQYVSGETSTRVIDITNASKIMTVKEFNKLVEQGKLSRYEIIGYKKVKSRDGVPFTIQKKSGKSMDDFSIYKMVNLYGDGKIVAEYPKLTTPSVFDNNTFKVEQEMSDDDIIKILSGEVIETSTETVLSPSTFPQTVEDVEVETKETEPKIYQIDEYSILETSDGFFDVQHAEDGIIAEYLNSYEDALDSINRDKSSRQNVEVDDVKLSIKSNEREYTPENIKSLKPNEVFVFGANTAGGHGGGTAGLAQRGSTSSNYTALPIGTKGKWSEYGIVDKLMQGTEGKSFGIVTKAATISGTSLKIGAKRSVPLSRIEESINALIKTANENPNLKFLVTKFGTNMAGFSEKEMKSLLENKNLPDNIILPKEFEFREFSKKATKVDNFKYFGKMYEIQLDENNNPIDVIGYKGKDANKQKLLEAYAENPNVDPQNNKPFREELEESTEGNSFKFEDGTVINTGSISLNEQQKEALQLAVNAIKKGQTKFVLRGYAGTGKSTISKFIREYLQQSNTFKDVKYSSPTHKANTNLLIQLIRGKVFGTLPSTTAKLLNKRKGENGKFIPGPKDQMPYNGVLIIDESSMIDSEDYNMLIDLAKRKSTTIVFMGDPAQLPPVGQKQLSKALQYESSAEGVELTQVMRQQGDNPLLDILTNIRQNLSSIVEKFNFRNKINGKGEGVQFTKSYDEFNNRIIEYFSSNEYKEDPTYAKILTYTNASVANYNNMIQAQLGLSPYAEGSILMGYEQVSEGSSINNGQDYIVLENEYVTNRPVTVFNGNVGNKSFNIQSNVSGYNVKLRRVFSKEDEQLLKDNKQESLLKPVEVFIINPSDDRNINFMEKVLAFKKVLNDNTISWRLRQDPLNELENFFNRYQLPADIISYKGNITTLPKLKEENPQLFKINKVTGKSEFEETASVDRPMLNKNIDYGYAVTSHKAQGSTYKYIFVDYENMENPANDKSILDNGVKYAVERQQLKYVGLSRASKVAIVFSRKAEEKLLDSKEEISNVPEIEESFVPSYEISESADSSEEYYLEIKSFYNTLTPEQKIKVGSLDGLIFQYEMIPFDINEEQFVESIRCKL